MSDRKPGLTQKPGRSEVCGPLPEGKRKGYGVAPGLTWLCECQAKSRIASLCPGLAARSLQKSPNPRLHFQCPCPRQKGHSRSLCGHHVDPSTGSCHQGTLTGLGLSLPDLGASPRSFRRPRREHTKPKWCLFTSSSQVL